MSTEHLSALAILSIEQDISLKLNLDEFVSAFANAHRNRRLQLY